MSAVQWNPYNQTSSPIHLVRFAERLAAHPEDAVVLEIRTHRLRAHDQHTLRRKGDAGNRKPLPFSMDDGRKSIARSKPCARAKLITTSLSRRVGQPAFLDIESIQKGFAVIGNGNDPGGQPVRESP